MKKLTIIFAIAAVAFFLAACGDDSRSSASGKFQDSRDGQVYKTVTIGTQTWMAENLNYAYLQPTSEEDSSSFCYNDEPDSCAKYGRLYLWSAAMDSAGVFGDGGEGCGYDVTCSAKEPVRGICPEGWHLPSDAEWETLFTAVGGVDLAGTKLKSKSGWYSGNGTDDYGFSCCPRAAAMAVAFTSAPARAHTSGVLRSTAATMRTTGASTTAASACSRITASRTSGFPYVASGTRTRGGVGTPLLAAA
ncbi:MAG: FISUMP domain-containing protein [Fibrobacter intestinalis]|uniref:fibrobacter succinogenes major paralogous domain-containing protein n=1 Tax=Fibrobacter intestinalis TaxID=28122 RepID=UPI003EFCE425